MRRGDDGGERAGMRNGSLGEEVGWATGSRGAGEGERGAGERGRAREEVGIRSGRRLGQYGRSVGKDAGKVGSWQSGGRVAMVCDSLRASCPADFVHRRTACRMVGCARKGRGYGGRREGECRVQEGGRAGGRAGGRGTTRHSLAVRRSPVSAAKGRQQCGATLRVRSYSSSESGVIQCCT